MNIIVKQVIMSDSVVIPELHLFSSHRRHKSPTKDTIEYHNYQLSRKKIQPFQLTSLSRPIYVPPIPIPPPEIHMPIPIVYPPISADFIRAPTTYIDYAEEYLMGHRSPVIPSARTARFSEKFQPSSKRTFGKCQCEVDQHIEQHRASLSKNVYLHNSVTPEIGKKNNHPKVNPPQIKKDPYFTVQTQRQKRKKQEEPKKVTPTDIPKKSKHESAFFQAMLRYLDECSKRKTIEEEQLQIFRSMLVSLYEKQTKRKSEQQKNMIQSLLKYIEQQHEKDTITEEQKNIFKAMIDDSIEAEKRKREQEQNGLIRGIASFAQKERQKDIFNEMINIGEEAVKKEETNNILIEKFMRKIPATLDSAKLHEIVSKKIEHFNSIKVDFEDLPIIRVEQLIEAKDEYLESSRDILLKLNELAGDRTQLSLMYKLFKFKQNGEMSWPDI